MRTFKVQRLLYATSALASRVSAFCPNRILTYSYGSENIAIISLTGINRLEFIMGRNKVKLSTGMLWRPMG